ncbi:MAG: preprotein translocase subunit SecE [Metamycoplasmataceae bacterium]
MDKEKNKKEEEIKKSENIIKQKPYVFRNFFKEIKRINWPFDEKKQKNFLLTFLLIIILLLFFSLISFGANELIQAMGAK